MSPRERLLNQISQLEEQAREAKPDGGIVNKLLSGIRGDFATVGAAHCPPARVNGVSPGTLDDARKLYGQKAI